MTAASLFDGHDAAINIIRRILQGMGAEVIHLGHIRSVDELTDSRFNHMVWYRAQSEARRARILTGRWFRSPELGSQG